MDMEGQRASAGCIHVISHPSSFKNNIITKTGKNISRTARIYGFMHAWIEKNVLYSRSMYAYLLNNTGKIQLNSVHIYL